MALMRKMCRITVEIYETADPTNVVYTLSHAEDAATLFLPNDNLRKMAADHMIEFKEKAFLSGCMDDFNRRPKFDWKPPEK